MFKHYFKTAWRNLRVNKFYSALNITGLAIGLATGIMLLLWVQNEFSYDKFNKNVNDVYRINSLFKGQSNGVKEIIYDVTPPILATYAKSIPDVKSVVRITSDYGAFSADNIAKPLNLSSAFIDDNFLNIFSYKLLYGNREKLFPNPYSIAVTTSVARKFFATVNVLGKRLLYNNQVFVITAVLQDFPKNSSLQYDVLLPMSYYAIQFSKDNKEPLDANENSYTMNTYVLLRPNADKDKTAKAFTKLHEKATTDTRFEYKLQSLNKIHLITADGDSSAYRMAQIFLIITVMLFVIASINYINLSTARSLIRAKEVGIKKIIGASKKQLFFQFIIETILLFVFAIIIAIGLIFILMPVYNRLSGKELRLALNNIQVWKALAIAVIGTLLLSSIYPAIVLSSFKPLQILKGKTNKGNRSAILRKSLVVFQFAISAALLFATIVISKQMHFVRNMKLGYDKTYVFSVTFPDAAISHLSAIETKLSSQKSIVNVAASDAPDFTSLGTTTTAIHWQGMNEKNSVFIYETSVDENFIPTMKIGFLEGHNFTGMPIDSASFILNETAVKQMGLKPPYVGQEITFGGHKGNIIGILKDFNFQSLKTAIAPLIFYSFNKEKNTLYVRTTAKNAQAAIAAVKKAYQKYADNNSTFSYSFLDKQFEAQYRSDIRTGTLFTTFTAIAIFISCLGLFGLATYTAEVKTKEIGIRKVLGASVGSIVKLISRDFLKLVIIAIVIATPIAYWAMNKWLNNFAYKTNIGIFTFIIAAVTVMLIAFGTIGFKAYKAARANPVKSLKTE
ncbi:hypothetical protein A9P82_05220 [Arachidicoccus ginsenosidimutans]|uniref:ABC transporter permease n=1 Tax=Arachidicoccus sp. BS20 TaxID=1850526 RepID=UPI0007F14CE4|nr:ABC transporter permease [Arachidicoccus sp. BS20]ANI88736.1 hypothetical protein A9P82_05220 [Arachidicoccus sp. BS20]